MRLSKTTLAEGESRDLRDGYSITVTEIDLKADKATFELIKKGRSIDSATVYGGGWFTLIGLDNFYFEATLDAIFVGTTANLVQLINSESGYTSGEEGRGTTDTTPPTVAESSPTSESVPVATQISITFSEPMNEESTEYAVHVYDHMQNEVSGKFSWDGNTMIFTPSSDLDYDAQYFVLCDDAMDPAGNSLYYEWNFKTGLPNNSPDIPNRPSGPSTGYDGTSDSYSSFSKDPDGDQIRYIFDWGDGTASGTEFVDSGRIVSQPHVWDSEGDYSVRVMAADSGGGESSWSPPLVVAISERAHPTAVISASSTAIAEGETVSFGAEGSKPGDPDGEIISYAWDFGDESTGTGVNVERTYPRSGHYTAMLTITDNNNLSATDSVSITVEPKSGIFVSISTGSIPSGESGEVLVRVTSNGDPAQGASVHLSATTGSLDPDEGVTDRDGEFVSIFTAPTVDATERYTIYAEAEVNGTSGEGLESNLIVVGPNIPPTAYMEIYPNPANEGESVTLDGWSGDEDGEVVEVRWTLPDGTIISDHGDSSELTIEPDEVVAGWYAFAAMDDDGVWSEEVGEELDVETIIPIVLVAIAVLAAGILLMIRGRNGRGITEGSNGRGNGEEQRDRGEKDEKPRYGSIHATSTPDDAVVLLDGLDIRGRSPVTIDNVPVGLHFLLFVKSDHFGYERKILVTADRMKTAHCDLTKVPEIGLKLSADPTEIIADGKSKSTITIEIEDKKERPIPVPKEIAVVVETNIGVVDSPAMIPAGKASTTSVIMSSVSGGTATVKAVLEIDGVLKLRGNIAVEFVESEVAT